MIFQGFGRRRLFHILFTALSSVVILIFFVREPTIETLLYKSRELHGAMAEITEDDSYWKATEEIMSALKTQEAFSYGEGLNMLEHALQAAFKAKQAGEPNDVQLACLCHDVGNSPQARAHWVHIGNDEPELIISKADTSIGYQNHDVIGGSYLASLGFSIEVSGVRFQNCLNFFLYEF